MAKTVQLVSIDYYCFSSAHCVILDILDLNSLIANTCKIVILTKNDIFKPKIAKIAKWCVKRNLDCYFWILHIILHHIRSFKLYYLFSKIIGFAFIPGTPMPLHVTGSSFSRFRACAPLFKSGHLLCVRWMESALSSVLVVCKSMVIPH